MTLINNSNLTSLIFDNDSPESFKNAHAQTLLIKAIENFLNKIEDVATNDHEHYAHIEDLNATLEISKLSALPDTNKFVSYSKIVSCFLTVFAATSTIFSVLSSNSIRSIPIGAINISLTPIHCAITLFGAFLTFKLQFIENEINSKTTTKHHRIGELKDNEYYKTILHLTPPFYDWPKQGCEKPTLEWMQYSIVFTEKVIDQNISKYTENAKSNILKIVISLKQECDSACGISK